MTNLENQLRYCGVDDYHKMGYKGQNIVIANHENNTEHSSITTHVLREVVPNATIINFEISAMYQNGKYTYFNFIVDKIAYTLDEFYNNFKPDIISVSFGGYVENSPQQNEMKKLIDKGVILVNAGGNDGTQGVTALYKDIAIIVGAVSLVEGKPKLAYYSAVGDKVDFVAFMGNSGTGTSCACPFLAGQIALIIQRYGKKNQAEIKELLVNYSRDLGENGKDTSYGNGIVIMPTRTAQIFEDVKPSRWSAKAIEYCYAKGIMNGTSQGKFEPEKPLTREEIATILERLGL